MKLRYGFTLIEILIALAVFAVLASITSSLLYYAFNTRDTVNKQAEQLNKIQLVMSILEQDILQIIDRPTRGNEMRLFPTFLGLSEYMEFTRGGLLNPKSIEKRSTLKRIGLLCKEGNLIRMTWDSLDLPNRNNSHEKILLTDLRECNFKYLNNSLQTLPEWREHAVNLEQKAEPFPVAVQLNLNLSDWGKMNLLFIIPEALYGAK